MNEQTEPAIYVLSVTMYIGDYLDEPWVMDFRGLGPAPQPGVTYRLVPVEEKR